MSATPTAQSMVDATTGEAAAQAPVIDRATADDAGEIWTVQRAAYLDEAQAYGDPYIAPLTETRAQIRAHIDSGTIVLKAVADGRIVGAVRGRASNTTFLINRLSVAPDQRRRGIARALLASLEDHALTESAEVTSFSLFTGHSSDGNLRLYRSLGYSETHRERIADHLTMVHLRKPAPGRA